MQIKILLIQTHWAKTLMQIKVFSYKHRSFPPLHSSHLISSSFHANSLSQTLISYKIFISCKLRFCHTSIPTPSLLPLFSLFTFNLIPLHLILFHPIEVSCKLKFCSYKLIEPKLSCKLRFFSYKHTNSIAPSLTHVHFIPAHPTHWVFMQIKVCSYKSHTKSGSCKLRFFHTSLHMSSYHLFMQAFYSYGFIAPSMLISFYSTHHVHLILSIPSIPSFVPSFLIQLLCLLCMWIYLWNFYNSFLTNHLI